MWVNSSIVHNSRLSFQLQKPYSKRMTPYTSFLSVRTSTTPSSCTATLYTQELDRVTAVPAPCANAWLDNGDATKHSFKSFLLQITHRLRFSASVPDNAPRGGPAPQASPCMCAPRKSWEGIYVFRDTIRCRLIRFPTFQRILLLSSYGCKWSEGHLGSENNDGMPVRNISDRCMEFLVPDGFQANV